MSCLNRTSKLLDEGEEIFGRLLKEWNDINTAINNLL
jgi:hypothetical protein